VLLWGAVILFSALQFIALWRVLSEWYRIWIRHGYTVFLRHGRPINIGVRWRKLVGVEPTCDTECRTLVLKTRPSTGQE
jgi:hypothetical protein